MRVVQVGYDKRGAQGAGFVKMEQELFHSRITKTEIELLLSTKYLASATEKENI